MKKLFALVLVVAAAGFAGCKKETAPPPPPVAAAPAPAPVAPQDPNATNPSELLEGTPTRPEGGPAAPAPQGL